MYKHWKNYIVLFILVIILFPFGYLIILSFSGEWDYPNIIPGYFGLKNWKAIITAEVGLLKSLVNSLVIAISVAFFSTLIGFLLSRIISRHQKRKKLLLLSYLPYVISPVVFAACLSYFFIKASLFGNLGGVIVAQLMICLPYAVIFFDGFWNKNISNMEGLVSTMGGSFKTSFFKVILPMAKGMLLICFFQTFLISWFEYGLTALIGVGKIQTLTIKVFLYIRESNFYYGALSSVMLILPPVLMLYFNKRYVFNRLK